MSETASARLPIDGLPEIEAGAKLGELIAGPTEVARRRRHRHLPEGRLQGRGPDPPALLGDTRRRSTRLAAVLGKEPALVELILEESREVLRAERGVLITETHHGFVCANAGIDSSNLPETAPSASSPRTPTPRPAASALRSRSRDPRLAPP